MTWPRCNDAKMLRLSLSSAQLRTVRIIQGVGFGVIRGLAVRDGHPSYDPPPRIVQSIKMGSQPEAVRPASDNDALKKAFADLFERLSTLGDCIVEIEVQHALPFRLIVERSCEEFD